MQRALTFILAILVLLLLPQATGLVPGLWQRPSPSVLHLTEQARVAVPLNEVRAEFRIRSQGADAAALQTQVDSTMARTLQRAGAVAGLRVTTGALWIGRVADSDAWQAERILTLESQELPQLAQLAAALEQSDLVMQAIVWRLTPQAEAAARLQAQAEALAAARSRVEGLATRLAMRIDRLTELRVDSDTQGRSQTVPTPFAPGAPVAPGATQAEVTVTLHVQVALRPLN